MAFTVKCGPQRHHSDWLLSNNPTDHIDIMDRRIMVNSTRDFEVGEGRESSIAATSFDLVKFSKLALVDVTIDI